MFDGKDLNEDVSKFFTMIETYIKYENKNGNFDINKYCEKFFCGLLNIVYKLNLRDLNELIMNFPAVDLGDVEEGICYQVTTEKTKKKIVDTINKFIKYGLDSDYSRLNILILGTKIKNQEFDTYDKLKFDINIIDLVDLSNEIKSLPTKRRQKVVKYLKKNVNIQTGKPSFYDSIITNKIKYPNNMKKYFNINDIHGDEKKEILDDYKKFINHLSNFDEDTRALIYLIFCNVYESYWGEINFSINELYGKLDIDRRMVNEKLEILYKRGDLNLASESESDYDCLIKYYNDFDVYSDLKNYCDRINVDYKVPLLKLDFSILD